MACIVISNNVSILQELIMEPELEDSDIDDNFLSDQEDRTESFDASYTPAEGMLYVHFISYISLKKVLIYLE